jgi:hypothetical protein
VKRRAVIGAGTVLRLDADLRPAERPNLQAGRRPADRDSEGASSCPGADGRTVGAGKDWGLSLATPSS